MKAAEFEGRSIPDIFVNQVKKRGVIECQTLDLKKLNHRVYESAMEAINQSDKVIQELLDSIRLQVRDLFRVCEAVALLDMLAAFAQLATIKGYVRPELTGTLALKSAKHPLLDAVRIQCFHGRPTSTNMPVATRHRKGSSQTIITLPSSTVSKWLPART